MPAVVLAFLVGLFLASGTAGAEKVKTNQSTKLYNRPGEQAKVLLKVKSGQSMTLLAKDGRWLKVRVNGRTGYVPRSKVDMADDGDIARNTRRRPFVDGRGKKRGESDGAPDDRVGADAMGDNASGGEDDESSDDDADDKPAKASTKPKVAAKASSDDDEEDEDKPAPKSKPEPKAKPAPAKVAEDDEDEDEEDDAPVAKAKPAAKVATKPTPKPAAKGSDDEDEDEEEDDAGDKPAAKTAKAETKDEESRPRARVTKRVSVRSEPDEEADEDFVVRPTDTLFLGDTKGSWSYVENSAGDGGWVQSDLLEEGQAAGGGGSKKIDVRARGGLLLVQQGMRSTASSVQTPPDNYNVKARMLAINLGGGIVLPKGKFLVGAELTYDLAKGTAPYEGMPDTSLTLHNVNVRALLGLDFKKPNGMALIGHLGYRYQGILVADVANPMANPASLPSEVVKGPAIGAALTIPRLRPKLGLDVSLDAMVFGASVTQTKGLEDGASPSAKAIVVGAGLSYHLSSVDVLARYELDYMGVDFGAPLATSTRPHMGTSISRTDLFHGVTVGVSKPF